MPPPRLQQANQQQGDIDIYQASKNLVNETDKFKLLM